MEDMMNNDRLNILLDKYFRKKHTPEEKAELLELLAGPKNEQAVKQWIDKGFTEELTYEMDAGTQNDILQSIVQLRTHVNTGNGPAPVVPVLKTAWLKYAAAIILLLGAGAYLWFRNSKPAEQATYTNHIERDVQPGGQKAVLILADGRQIILDSAANGELAVEQGHQILKQDGQIIYGGKDAKNVAVSFNTMSTPRGGQYQLTLHDGTKVWLNALSSIRFPPAFTGKNREVEVSGEVYMEVAGDPLRPFVVRAGQDRIFVLGTSFNLNYYPDEPLHKVSLVEGSVKINGKILKPQEAYAKGKITSTDISQDIAWKSGVFNFENMNLQQAMRQLARWYDLEIVYQGEKLPEIEFGGKMGMDLKLSQVLKGLEIAGLQFRIGPGKKLIITQ